MSIKENIVQSFNTINEMLNDRGILDDDDKTFLSSFRDFEYAALCTAMSTPIFNIDVGTKLRIVYYMSKFKMADFKSFIEDAEFSAYILVTTDQLTKNNLKSIQEFQRKNDSYVSLQVFHIKELLFNITKHEIVPKHEVISNEEDIAKLIERYNVKSRSQFPLILRTDPIAKYYDVKPGNLVKVTRVSPSSGEYVLYRCCV